MPPLCIRSQSHSLKGIQQVGNQSFLPSPPFYPFYALNSHSSNFTQQFYLISPLPLIYSSCCFPSPSPCWLYFPPSCVLLPPPLLPFPLFSPHLILHSLSSPQQSLLLALPLPVHKKRANIIMVSHQHRHGSYNVSLLIKLDQMKDCLRNVLGWWKFFLSVWESDELFFFLEADFLRNGQRNWFFRLCVSQRIQRRVKTTGAEEISYWTTTQPSDHTVAGDAIQMLLGELDVHLFWLSEVHLSPSIPADTDLEHFSKTIKAKRITACFLKGTKLFTKPTEWGTLVLMCCGQVNAGRVQSIFPFRERFLRLQRWHRKQHINSGGNLTFEQYLQI